jgi:hypothetical protein
MCQTNWLGLPLLTPNITLLTSRAQTNVSLKALIQPYLLPIAILMIKSSIGNLSIYQRMVEKYPENKLKLMPRVPADPKVNFTYGSCVFRTDSKDRDYTLNIENCNHGSDLQYFLVKN